MVTIAGANHLSDISIYQNLMLSVGSIQAVVTGYLSFKIFEVSKRDSGVPEITTKIKDVEEKSSHFDDHCIVRCTVRVMNKSYGRSKITDIKLDTQFAHDHRISRNKDSSRGSITQGFPDGVPAPKILDKGQYVDVIFQINGYAYFESATLKITDQTMGTLEFHMIAGEIDNKIRLQKAGRADEEKEP